MENIRNSNTEPQKETSFPDYEKLKTLRQQLFEELPTREYSASSLVRGKEYRQQINLIIENGYKNSGSVTSGLCSYVCFYPLCLVTKEDIDTKIESKITIPLFYDVATLSEEMVEKARLLNAKIHAFFNKIDFYSVIDTSETNCVIQTWQPIYRIAELISQNFYKQVVKDTLKIAYEASGQA